jgi:hypothetical protein
VVTALPVLNLCSVFIMSGDTIKHGRRNNL